MAALPGSIDIESPSTACVHFRHQRRGVVIVPAYSPTILPPRWNLAVVFHWPPVLPIAGLRPRDGSNWRALFIMSVLVMSERDGRVP